MSANKNASVDMVELPFGIELPESIANMILPAPELVMYYRNIENRILWLDSDVTVNWLEFERQIIDWNREDRDTPVEQRKPIRLMFFSNGGDLEVNNSFVSLVKLSKTPIIGINMGIANSAGCYIFMSCHKRYAMPGSQFLIHQGSANGLSGTFLQVSAYMDDYNRKMDALHKYILENTKISVEVLEQKMKGEWFVTADEAVSLGVCDKIVEDISELF